MFRRRAKRSIVDQLRDFFWPRIGWRRSSTYVVHRLGRMHGTPYSIAAGFAFGAAISFTPFVGLHLIMAALLSWICRANVFASAIGTLAGNPWTFPFIWAWIYEFGKMLGVGHPNRTIESESLPQIFGNVVSAILSFNVHYIGEIAWPILAPMIAGGLPTAIIVWLAAFFAFRPMIVAYKHSRLKHLRKRAEMQREREAPV